MNPWRIDPDEATQRSFDRAAMPFRFAGEQTEAKNDTRMSMRRRCGSE